MLGFQPGSKEGKGRRQREIFIHILATATCPSTGLPNAKGKAILSTQWAKYIPRCSAAARLPVKHIGLSWMTSIFQKCFFFSSTTKTPHYACISKQNEQFIHDWESWRSRGLWSLSQRLKMPGMFSVKRKKEKKKRTAEGQKESKPVCLIKEHHWEPPKAASFPFPAQKGRDNCSSRGFEKGPSLPPREGGAAFQHPTSTIHGRTPAGSWQHPPLRTPSQWKEPRDTHTFP